MMVPARPSTADRPLDLALVGATGYTGRLVAAYLAPRAGGLRWAVAGRDGARLDAVRAGAAPGAERRVLDLHDPEQAAALAREARVVCTTAGPYLLHGRALVAACAEHGTAYADLTGEVPFMRETIDRHDGTARRSGARIVPACGFDSIPSDLGVLALHDHAAQAGERLVAARYRVVRMRGGVSGGSAASLRVIGEAARDPAVRRLLADPHALDPREADAHALDPRGVAPSGTGPVADRHLPRRDPATGRWLAPFVMATINTRVVRRSNALAGFPYGRDFRYEEVVDAGAGARGALRAWGIAAFLGVATALARSGAGRALLARVSPKPGTGPSDATRAGGSFEIVLEGTTATGRTLRYAVAAPLDPGYGATAVMLAESALLLAQTAGSGERPGGVLTPATALGLPLVARLRAAGFRFEPLEVPPVT